MRVNGVGKRRVTRQEGEAMLEECMISRLKSGQRSIMVWGGGFGMGVGRIWCCLTAVKVKGRKVALLLCFIEIRQPREPLRGAGTESMVAGGLRGSKDTGG